jgi:hypothetical protein
VSLLGDGIAHNTEFLTRRENMVDFSDVQCARERLEGRVD